MIWALKSSNLANRKKYLSCFPRDTCVYYVALLSKASQWLLLKSCSCKVKIKLKIGSRTKYIYSYST